MGERSDPFIEPDKSPSTDRKRDKPDCRYPSSWPGTRGRHPLILFERFMDGDIHKGETNEIWCMQPRAVLHPRFP